MHQNTAREHLDALVERGLAVRAQQTSHGRGRPAWVYAAAVDNVEPDQRASNDSVAGSASGACAWPRSRARATLRPEAAKRYPQVVCQVHLGIVRGAMDVIGGSPERTAITPFAEPGACRLQLRTP